MSSLISTIRVTIEKHHMLSKRDRVLVAVSGGPDSVALLHILAQIVPDEYFGQVSVFHLNHKIRGYQADEDATFVHDLAQSLNLAAVIRAYDVPDYMREHNLSIEEAARIVRYQQLNEVAHKLGVSRIALGHHENDQAETFLMNLLRGSGLDGLRAMLPVRDMFIRPMIEVKKEMILHYLEENEISYKTDASNEDMSYVRNRVRHELIPILRSYNPKIEDVLCRTVTLVQDDQYVLEQQSDEIYREHAIEDSNRILYQTNVLIAQPKALQRRLIRKAIMKIKGDLHSITFKHIDTILLHFKEPSEHLKIDLPGGVVVSLKDGIVEIARRSLRRTQTFEPYVLEIPGVTTIKEIGCTIETCIKPLKDLSCKFEPHSAFLDADKIIEPITVRRRQEGDRFVPFGLNGRKKLQDFMVDSKIPFEQRDSIPIVVSGDEIVWIAGYRIDNRYRITEDTNRVLSMRLVCKELHTE